MAAIDQYKTKRRDQFYIISEILEVTKEGTLKTQVMYRCNLSFTQLNDYLLLMQKKHLLEKKTLGEKEIYKATNKGLDFLQRYREIKEMLKTEDNNKIITLLPKHLLQKK